MFNANLLIRVFVIGFYNYMALTISSLPTQPKWCLYKEIFKINFKNYNNVTQRNCENFLSLRSTILKSVLI